MNMLGDVTCLSFCKHCTLQKMKMVKGAYMSVWATGKMRMCGRADLRILESVRVKIMDLH